jgi:hypothetical protein
MELCMGWAALNRELPPRGFRATVLQIGDR